jgi:hypothetical protein
MIDLMINIRDRKIVNMQELKAAFNSLKDGKHQVTIKDVRNRSLPQNDYYWSVVVPMCRVGLYDAGYDEVKTNDDAHEVLKHVHLRRRMVSKQTGDVIDIAGSSAKLTVAEFSEYIESICKWSAEFLSVVIPSPNEELRTFAEHNDYLNKTELF